MYFPKVLSCFIVSTLHSLTVCQAFGGKIDVPVNHLSMETDYFVALFGNTSDIRLKKVQHA